MYDTSCKYLIFLIINLLGRNMLENLKDKMCALNDVFIEYPKVFNRMMFYFILILGVILAYFPLIKWLVN